MGRLNIKVPSHQYRDSHVKDKTASPTVLSLTWESPYLKKTVFILRMVTWLVGSKPDNVQPVVWAEYLDSTNHLSLAKATKDWKLPFICTIIKLVINMFFFFFFFFIFNDISPGSSHPSIQRGARPLTGDLPTTAPSPLTFEFWKLFPTFFILPMAILPVKC